MGASVVLSVAWDVMPVSGAMRSSKEPGTWAVSGIKLPSKLCSKPSKCAKTVTKLPTEVATAIAASGALRGAAMAGASPPRTQATTGAASDEL